MSDMDLIRSFTGKPDSACAHVPAQMAAPSGQQCEACGSTYNLRMCAQCGHVGCCDSQAGDARRHYAETGHEVMASMPVGAGFVWCYKDDKYVD